MKNAVQVFENAEFGRVRTIEVKGSPYFVGKDVAEILGYSNPQKAIRDHVDDEDRTVNDSFTVNGTKGLLRSCRRQRSSSDGSHRRFFLPFARQAAIKAGKMMQCRKSALTSWNATHAHARRISS